MNESPAKKSWFDWLQRHTKLLAVTLLAVATACISTFGGVDGLTTYVLFVAVLFVSKLARLLGREFQIGFALASFLWMFGSLVAFAIVEDFYGTTVNITCIALFITYAVFLWCFWAYHSIRTPRFRQKLAMAFGITWGWGLAFFGVAFLWWGVDVNPSDYVGFAILLLSAPFGFFVPWALCRLVWRLWQRIRSQTEKTRDVRKASAETNDTGDTFAEPSCALANSRRFQFSLRSLFLLILAAAIGMGWLRAKYNAVQRQAAAIESLRPKSESYLHSPSSYGTLSRPYWLGATLGRDYFLTGSVLLRKENLENDDLKYIRDFLNPIGLFLEGNFNDQDMIPIGAARNLASLSLAYTCVTDQGLAYLKNLTNLRELGLEGTRITDSGLQHLSRMHRLHGLSLSDNSQITDAGMVHLAYLASLEHLDLSGTKVTGAGLADLEHLELRFLDLDGTPITDKGLLHLPRLKPSRWARRREVGFTDSGVSLNGTEITDLGLKHLRNKPGLAFLSVSGTRITDASLVYVQEMTDLYFLRVSDTGITDAGLKHLEELGNLESLDLTGTRVTTEGIKRLKQALPNCNIHKR